MSSTSASRWPAAASSRATSTCSTGGAPRPAAAWSSSTTRPGPSGVDADVAPLVDRYRLQGASYALAVEQATGEAVVDVRFAFLTPEGPVEAELPDLAGAVAHVRRLAEAGDPSLIAVG